MFLIFCPDMCHLSSGTIFCHRACLSLTALMLLKDNIELHCNQQIQKSVPFNSRERHKMSVIWNNNSTGSIITLESLWLFSLWIYYNQRKENGQKHMSSHSRETPHFCIKKWSVWGNNTLIYTHMDKDKQHISSGRRNATCRGEHVMENVLLKPWQVCSGFAHRQ